MFLVHLFDELLDLGDLDVDLEVVGVLHGDFALDGAQVVLEDRHAAAERTGLEDQAARGALADLDVSVQDVWVVADELERGDGHDLRDGAELEAGLLGDGAEVGEHVGHVLEGVEHQGVDALQALLGVLGLGEVWQGGCVVAPDLAGPERALVFEVFGVVADDVCLLEEEAHALEELFVGLVQVAGAKVGVDDHLGEAVADQPGDVVAVEVVVLDGLHAVEVEVFVQDVVGHPVAHLAGDLLDDALVGGLERVVLLEDAGELDQHGAVLFVGAVAVERPVLRVEFRVELAQQLHLELRVERHVVFDRVQRTQDQVEQHHDVAQLRVQFHDHCSKRPGGQAQQFVASSQFRGRGGILG